MLRYRNKFAAHLDLDEVMHLPHLGSAELTVDYYHSHVVAAEAAPGVLAGLPQNLGQYYETCAHEAQEVYAA
ncbi:MAG: hypothetical protein ACREYE_15200 [Gammaproteobacteria bacterium]